MNFLGVDIGGANLKFADRDGTAVSVPFPLWKTPSQLAETLAECFLKFNAYDSLAVTMTGELADCFETKSNGVTFILDAVQAAAAGKPIVVWQTAGEFVPVEVAKEFWMLTASANWHALATWAGRVVPSRVALLIDLGSTTTDIIPISNGQPISVGRTDKERLLSGELLYRGTKRTPLCAIASEVTYGKEKLPLAAELFATTHDLFLLSGDVEEQKSDTETADGRPAIKEHARTRIAHQFCCDRKELTISEIDNFAMQIRLMLQGQIEERINQVCKNLKEQPTICLLSGSGEFFARQIISSVPALKNIECLSLSEMTETPCSTAACAFAVARIAAERLSRT